MHIFITRGGVQGTAERKAIEEKSRRAGKVKERWKLITTRHHRRRSSIRTSKEMHNKTALPLPCSIIGQVEHN